MRQFNGLGRQRVRRRWPQEISDRIKSEEHSHPPAQGKAPKPSTLEIYETCYSISSRAYLSTCFWSCPDPPCFPGTVPGRLRDPRRFPAREHQDRRGRWIFRGFLIGQTSGDLARFSVSMMQVCTMRSLVRQDKPGRSNILKGGYLVNCPFDK